MAGCGIRVLTPELPDIKDYHVDSTSVKVIGEAVQWDAKETGGPVGVMGLSFSGGLALIASARPALQARLQVRLCRRLSGLHEPCRPVLRHQQGPPPNGTTELLPAHEYGPLVLEYEYLEDFVPKPDIARIRAVLRAHLYEDKPAEDAAALKLNDRQKFEALELMDATSPHTRDLIAKANAKHADEMAGLSPRGKLARMTTPVYLLHGEADNIIPSAETLWMASELPSESLQAMLVTPVISHVNFGDNQPGPWEEWKLIHFFALVMHATETPSAAPPGSETQSKAAPDPEPHPPFCCHSQRKSAVALVLVCPLHQLPVSSNECAEWSSLGDAHRSRNLSQATISRPQP